MSRFLVLMYSFSFSLLSVCQTYDEALKVHRDTTDHHLFTKGVIEVDSGETFTGLNYFLPDTNFRVIATYKPIKRGKTFEMATSTKRKPLYKVFAKATFEMEGEKQTLILYQNVALSKKPGFEDYLFCPFKDATNGSLTYGGGRYIDVRSSDVKDGTIVLDFNFAYNPYCAYSYRYSCPIPPKENHLQVSINAGVKMLDQDH